MLIHRFRSYASYFFLIVGLSSGLLVNTAAAAQGVPAQVIIVSGNQQAGIVGTALPNPFVVLVSDSNGNPVPNATVVWTVVAGGASFPAATTITNSKGLASNTMTLGTLTAWDKATAYSAKAGVTIGANAKPGPAQTIALQSGDHQTGTVGSTLPGSLQVVCRDQYGNLSSQTQINWAVTSGGGSVPYYESPTVNGVAVKNMTLGTVPGVNTVTATINGTGTSYTFNETAVAGPPAAMSIVSGNNQTGSPDSTLPNPFTVQVTDAYGNPLSGVPVDWAASTTGDTFPARANSTISVGQTSNTLSLGRAFGVHTATATVRNTNIVQTLTASQGISVTMQNNPNPNPSALQPYFLGLSYPRTWVSTPLFDPNNAALVTLFKNLGPGVLRFLAEESVNPVTWNPSGRGLIYGTVSTADIARVAAFAKATNWKVLYGIALFDSTPAAAASEAAVASQEFGSSLLGFEIGNEPDAYSTAHYGTPPAPQIPGYTWQDYLSPTTLFDSNGNPMPSWVVFANAIRTAVPNAPLTGPTGGYNWAMNFAVGAEAPQISLLTMHYYAQWATEVPTPTPSSLLATDPRLATWLPGLQQAAAAANIPGGYRISECNSVSISPIPGVTNGFGAALWTIDFLFENAFGQSSGVNMTSVGSYSPLYDNEKTVTGIGPDYYGLFAYSLLDKGGTLMTTQAAPASSTFSAYAVQQTDGSTDAILSNKDPVNSITVAITPQNPMSQATSLLLTAPSLSSTTGFQLGGSPINIDGSWTPSSNPAVPLVGNQAVVTVPPGSAQLVHMR